MTKRNDYLSTAIKAAQIAGTYLLRNKTAKKAIDQDLPHDLKLGMDRTSEHKIIHYLRQHTSFPILSEEKGMINGSHKDYYWVVDPIDGTINYYHQIPLSCVSIALCHEGKPILGVINDFNRGELFTALVGKGAWLNGQRIHVSAINTKKKAVLATGFPSQSTLSSTVVKRFAQDLKTFKKVRLLGTAALSMAYVAAGRLDAYHEQDIMFWDVAAGAALVEAAGGKVNMVSKTRLYCYDVGAHNGLLK